MLYCHLKKTHPPPWISAAQRVHLPNLAFVHGLLQSFCASQNLLQPAVCSCRGLSALTTRANTAFAEKLRATSVPSGLSRRFGSGRQHESCGAAVPITNTTSYHLFSTDPSRRKLAPLRAADAPHAAARRRGEMMSFLGDQRRSFICATCICEIRY
jgi:hypothetical protein